LYTVAMPAPAELLDDAILAQRLARNDAHAARC